MTFRLLSRSATQAARARPLQSAPIAIRSFQTSRAARAEAGSQPPKRSALLSAELFPLYAIVALAVSAGLFSISKHLFTDNDIRRLPETPDESGKPLARPDWQEVKRAKTN